MAFLLIVRFTNCLLSALDGITIYNFLFIYDSVQIKIYGYNIIKLFFVSNNKKDYRIFYSFIPIFILQNSKNKMKIKLLQFFL